MNPEPESLCVNETSAGIKSHGLLNRSIKRIFLTTDRSLIPESINELKSITGWGLDGSSGRKQCTRSRCKIFQSSESAVHTVGTRDQCNYTGKVFGNDSMPPDYTRFNTEHRGITTATRVGGRRVYDGPRARRRRRRRRERTLYASVVRGRGLKQWRARFSRREAGMNVFPVSSAAVNGFRTRRDHTEFFYPIIKKYDF